MGSDMRSCIVVHDDEEYDITKFLKNHPGGYNYIHSYAGSRIRDRMRETKHSLSALSLLHEYRTKTSKNNDQIDEVLLEVGVDWNKAILPQVSRLGSHYVDWISVPVDREVKLFDNFLLESLTTTPWYVVPIFWTPIISYILYSGIIQIAPKDITLLCPCNIKAAVAYVTGILLWTIIEYSLHRWIFHMVPSGNSKMFLYFHFAIHGLHHKVPFDSKRLVFPPVPASIIAFLARILYRYIFPLGISDIIFAGTLTGYVIYDMIHFYLHYGAPKEGSYLYTMKRYHNQHHFSHSESGFGISSSYWDKIFGTVIKLRKLAEGIKW